MRAANGKLIVAENGSGKISALSVNGDKASVTVIKDGTQHTNRSRTCRRHDLDCRGWRGQAVPVPCLNSLQSAPGSRLRWLCV